MSTVYQEFLDQNLHRAYPLTDESGGLDNTGTFRIPTSLITDIYLCVPNLLLIDCRKFYVENILIRRYFIDITIGYNDSGVPRPLGTFKNISTQAAVQSSYAFTPSQYQSNDVWTPLYHMTGQIVIGDAAEAIRYLGSWTFNQSDAEHSSLIVPTRIARGLLNVQYISINGRLFTGNVVLREGNNVKMQVDTRLNHGLQETVITFSASLNAAGTLQLLNDDDIFDALVNRFGVPIQTINGLRPDAEHNFNVLGADCTTVDPSGAHGVVVANPCATPCCDEDQNIKNIMDSIANLNLRYAQLKAFFDASAAALNGLQNKILVLGSEV